MSLQLLVGRLGRRRRAGGGGGDGRERDAVQVGDEGLPPSTECSVQRLATERRAKVNDAAPPGPVQSTCTKTQSSSASIVKESSKPKPKVEEREAESIRVWNRSL